MIDGAGSDGSECVCLFVESRKRSEAEVDRNYEHVWDSGRK